MGAIRTVLVANRGEIACRIQRTCKQLSIRTAVVFTEADRHLPFVQQADIACCIGEGAVEPSYLNIDVLLEAATRMNADAVHPGYGFLAENAQFAQRVLDAGLIWIGPPPSAIAAMGDKIEARAMASAHNVPVVPGTEEDIADPEQLKQAATHIGFPLLVKASAGGGGRGMRRVDQVEDLEEAVLSARREAQSAFGDEQVFLERLVEHPRHIEVQILADTHGRTLHLGERECSIQRRHQKIIEEAPSPTVDDAFRAQLGAAAVRMAEAVGYVGAGTVEFIVDPQGRYYFLEMNTRLQVEHPVTEEVTGLDLVQLQLDVAQGAPLALSQEDITFQGHALEARLYAENPLQDYMPTTGTLHRVLFPSAEGVRIEAGYTSGNAVSPYYDTLIAKVVAWGPTRPIATRRLRAALEGTWIPGPATNLGLLKSILDTDAWAAGDLETHFLPRENLPAALPLNEALGALIATAYAGCLRLTHSRTPSGALLGWRVWGPATHTDEWQSFGETVPVRWQWIGSAAMRIAIGDTDEEANWHTIRHLSLDGDLLHGELDGLTQTWRVCHVPCTRRPSPTVEAGDQLFLHLGQGEALMQLLPRLPAPATTEDEPGTLSAPTPGTIVQVCAQPGDTVEKGQTLIILEAMKMEHRVLAPYDGEIEKIQVEVGDSVDQGATLVRLCSPEDAVDS